MTANRSKMALMTLAAILAVCSVPFAGWEFISPPAILEPANADALIFWRLRLPRAIAAFLAGGGLAISGLLFQTMFHNPLATPYTLGVSSGAALGASLYARTGLTLPFAGASGLLFSALSGSLLSMLMVYLISRARGSVSAAVLLLAGVITSFFFSSLVMFVQYMSNANDAFQIMRWLMGSIAGIEARRLPDLGFVALGGAWLAWKLAPELDLLSAGEEIAASRGVDVRRVNNIIFILGSVIVGVIVSVTGPIGFVGMMTPQICRLWLGYRHFLLVPASLLAGGTLLCLCDLLARTLLYPAEVPIGIITAMLGAPFFLWTLLRVNGGELP